MAADYVISTVLQAHTGQYKRDMNDAANTTSKFGDTAAPAAKKTESLGSQLTKLAGYTYAAKKGFDATVGAAISWESSFAGVTKTVNGTTAELAAIEDGLRSMSKEIPTSADELANIAASAGQLGIETPNVLGFTRVIADLGETTNMTGEQAATSLARLANVTGMAQTDFDRLGSTVVELGNNLATTESEIVEMGLRLAGAGNQVGMTEDEILSLGAALSSVGIEAEAGGSAVSKVMIEIASQVENAGDDLGTFARVAGMSAEEFSAAWRDDAAGALVAFITGLGDTEAQGKSTLQILEELGITEVRMRDALLRTSSASDILNQSLEMGEAAWEANLALAQEAAVRYDTTASNIEELKNTFVDLGRDVGEKVTPALSEAASATTDFLNAELRQVTVGEAMATGIVKLIPGLNGYTIGAADAAEATDRMQRASDASTGRLQGLADQYAATQAEGEDYTGGLDETSEATGDLAEETAELTDLQKALAGALDTMPGVIDAYQSSVEELATATAEATADTSDSWDDFADSVDVSISEVNSRLQEQIRAQAEWERNLVVIAERAGADVALALAEMGEEGVGLVAELVDSSDEEMSRFAALMRTRAEQGGENAAVALEEKLEDAATRGGVRLHNGLISLGGETKRIMNDVGALGGEGFVNGLNSRLQSVINSATELAGSASSAMRRALDVRSPSKVFYEIGEQTIDGYVLAIEDGGRDVDAAVQGVIDKALSGVDAIMGGFGALAGRGKAQGGVAGAQAELDRLRARQQELPGLVGAASHDVFTQRRLARQITPAEEAQILRARERLTAAEQDLADARTEGNLSADQMRLLELDIVLAQETLTSAQEEAVGPTRDLAEAEEMLADLREEQSTMVADLEAAELALVDAQLKAVAAEGQLLEAGQDLIDQGPAGEALFRSLGEAAGLTKQQIDGLIASYRELAEVATGQASATGGQVVASRDELLRAALSKAGVAFGDRVDAADIVAGLRKIGHDFGARVDPEDEAVLLRYGGKRAGGGRVDPSHWYTVGERGPETFVPDMAGRIVPAGGDGASIPTVQVFLGDEDVTRMMTVKVVRATGLDQTRAKSRAR